MVFCSSYYIFARSMSLKRWIVNTGQSSSCNLKNYSCIFYYWYYIPSLSYYISSLLLHLVMLRPSPRRGTSKRDDCQRSAAQMPRARRRSTGWLVVRKERKREREREINLTCPKIEARYERARIQMDTDERATKAGTRLSSSPLALDEISLHPVRDIFCRLQLFSQRFSAILKKKLILNDALFDFPLFVTLMRYELFIRKIRIWQRTRIPLYECKMNDLYLSKETLLS